MKLAIGRSPATALSPAVFCLSWGLVSLLIVMVSLQLMTFEKFAPIIQNYQLFDNFLPGKILAAGIVTLEVLALPFLLRMNLSPLFRIVSAGSLVLAGLTWLVLGIWVIAGDPPTIGSGIFGGLLTHISQLLVAPFGIFLVIASLAAIYGLRRDFKT